jgi:hypothetical protein
MSEELRALTVEQLINKIKVINGMLLERNLTGSELEELISVAEEILVTCATAHKKMKAKS